MGIIWYRGLDINSIDSYLFGGDSEIIVPADLEASRAILRLTRAYHTLVAAEMRADEAFSFCGYLLDWNPARDRATIDAEWPSELKDGMSLGVAAHVCQGRQKHVRGLVAMVGGAEAYYPNGEKRSLRGTSLVSLLGATPGSRAYLELVYLGTKGECNLDPAACTDSQDDCIAQSIIRSTRKRRDQYVFGEKLQEGFGGKCDAEKLGKYVADKLKFCEWDVCQFPQFVYKEQVVVPESLEEFSHDVDPDCVEAEQAIAETHRRFSNITSEQLERLVREAERSI